jgi:hypothetical protein
MIVKKRHININLEIDKKLSSKKEDQIQLKQHSFSQEHSQQNKNNTDLILNEDGGNKTKSLNNNENYIYENISYNKTDEDSKITYEFRDK